MPQVSTIKKIKYHKHVTSLQQETFPFSTKKQPKDLLYKLDNTLLKIVAYGTDMNRDQHISNPYG